MTLEALATILAIAVPLSAAVLWMMRSTVSPLKVVIENNTKAMDRVVLILDRHDAQLDDHETRIVKIETVHEIEGTEPAKGGAHA